jgi:hypothetical protein
MSVTRDVSQGRGADGREEDHVKTGASAVVSPTMPVKR